MSANVYLPAVGFAKFCTTTCCFVFRTAQFNNGGLSMRNRSWNSLALTMALAATTLTCLLAAQQTASSPAAR
jgi:hypothetical protein